MITMMCLKPFCSQGRSQELCGWHTPAQGWVEKTHLMDGFDDFPGFRWNNNLQPTSLRLQHLYFWSGLTQPQINHSLGLDFTLDLPNENYLLGGNPQSSWYLWALWGFCSPCLYWRSPNSSPRFPNPHVHPLRLPENSPGILWLRDGHRFKPESAEVGCQTSAYFSHFLFSHYHFSQFHFHTFIIQFLLCTLSLFTLSLFTI